MNSKNGELLGTYNVKKLLIKLSIPAILGMFVNALYNLVDTLFVGMSSGNIAIGALGIAFPIHMIIVAFALMIGIGGASVFSRAFGRGDSKTMVNVVNTALRIDFIGAVVITAIGLVFIDEILIIFGATTSNIGFAKDYMGIILFGIIPMSLQMILNNFVRAEGRAKTAMVSMILGAGLNIILDPFFIFEEINIFGLIIPALGLGVKGAAFATVISQVVGFSFIFSMALSKESKLRINLRNWFDINLRTIKEIALVGTPTLVRNSVLAILVIFVNNLINVYAVGDPAIFISMYSVINRVFLIIFLPAFGVMQGLGPIVGFNFGARKFARLKDAVIFGTKIIVIYLFLGFLFVQFFSNEIFDFFSKSDDTFFIKNGSDAFKIISIGYVLVGFNIVIGGFYQSLGYAKKAMMIAVSRQLLLFTPIVIILSPIYGIMGIWYSFAISDTIAGLIGLFLMIYEIRILNKLE